MSDDTLHNAFRFKNSDQRTSDEMTSSQTATDSLLSVKLSPHDASDRMSTYPTNCIDASVTRSSFSSIQTSSTASHERQEREAQDAFNELIAKLCQDLWPPPMTIKHRFLSSQVAKGLRTYRCFRSLVPVPQIPLIQHLEGGGFNHITSITLPPSYPENRRNLILRVPRADDSRPDQQVATLNYVRQRTSIPVAKIEATDFTCDNAVGKPYVLQRRIPGRDLDDVWDDLSHSQRRVVAKEVGILIKTLLSLESPVAGTIEAVASGSETPGELPHIVPFTLMDAHGNPLENLRSANAAGEGIFRPREDILGFFEFYLSRWRELALVECPGEVNYDVKLYDDMLNAAREMDAMGLFKPDLNCLCHLDLYPRNIMVDVRSDNSIQITGILDWDETVFAPKFVNCEPPGWLWGYDKETHTENSVLPWPYELEGASKLPSTPEQQELKSIFDEHAGPEYPRLAYEESSRLIRGLYRIATLGLTASWHSTAAERIVKEWEILRTTLEHKK